MLFALILGLAACGSTSSTGGSEDGGNTSGGSGSSDGEGTVNIGYTGPLSGAAAFYGERTLNGLKLAVDEINEAGGFEVAGKTYKINLVTLDDKYMPNDAGSNAKRLIQEHHTPIIYTPHSGGIYAMQVFNEQDKFIIGGYSSEPGITAEGNSLTVRIPPSYDVYLETFTSYTMERFGGKIAFLPPSTQYGKDWSEALIPHWEDQGGEVVYNESIDFSKDTDFFTIITNALKENPDVLFVGGASEPTAKVVTQARELGFEGGFVLMDQAKLDEMKAVTGSYDALEGAIGTMPLIHSDSPGVPAFIEKYRDKYDTDPGSEAGLHYISMLIFVEAMKAAGTVDDVEKIREHMKAGIDAIPEENKVYLVTDIDEGGGLVIKPNIGAIENGEPVKIPVVE